jgi:hypothetical protein
MNDGRGNEQSNHNLSGVDIDEQRGKNTDKNNNK